MFIFYQAWQSTKNYPFSLDSLDDENETDKEENLKWIRHFVKMYNADILVYPEMEKRVSIDFNIIVKLSLFKVIMILSTNSQRITFVF